MSYLKSNDLFKRFPTEGIFQRIPRPMLIADHLMTPDNLGAMIRLADNIGATEVCFLGKEEEHRLGKVRRAAASSRDNIRWYFSEETDLHKIVPEGKTIVAIETADNATCIYDTSLPEDVAFVVGSERDGLSDELLKQCDQVVYIPVPGPTRSLNVSHAAAVAVFEWLRQMLLVLVVLFLSSCHRHGDSLVGRWTVDRVNVEFNEHVATPEMVRQYGVLERDNLIEIHGDSTFAFISEGDTLCGRYAVKEGFLYFDGKKFGHLQGEVLTTETSTPIGKITVDYRKGN